MEVSPSLYFELDFELLLELLFELPFALWIRLKCFRQQSDIVVEQLKIRRDFFYPANRRQVFDNRSSGFTCDRVRRLAIEIGLDHDHLNVIALHHVDDFQGVARGRRNARPWLNKAHNVESEVVGKVGRRVMVSNYFAAMERLHVGLALPISGSAECPAVAQQSPQR